MSASSSPLSTSDPIPASPDIELPEGLWETAIAAKHAVRYVDHPGNYAAVYGMTKYALQAVVAAAFAAGRESVWAEAETEYRVYHGDDRPDWKCYITASDELAEAQETAALHGQHGRTWVEQWQTLKRQVA